MNYLKFSLRQQQRGTTVQVDLTGTESDVFLVDSLNLTAFERGQQYICHGGHFNNSPVQLSIPSPGDWTTVVIPGPGGQVRASVRTIPTA